MVPARHAAAVVQTRKRPSNQTRTNVVDRCDIAVHRKRAPRCPLLFIEPAIAVGRSPEKTDGTQAGAHVIPKQRTYLRVLAKKVSWRAAKWLTVHVSLYRFRPLIRQAVTG